MRQAFAQWSDDWLMEISVSQLGKRRIVTATN
jgi:hypothetical protein